MAPPSLCGKKKKKTDKQRTKIDRYGNVSSRRVEEGGHPPMQFSPGDLAGSRRHYGLDPPPNTKAFRWISRDWSGPITTNCIRLYQLHRCLCKVPYHRFHSTRLRSFWRVRLHAFLLKNSNLFIVTSSVLFSACYHRWLCTMTLSGTTTGSHPPLASFNWFVQQWAPSRWVSVELISILLCVCIALGCIETAGPVWW